MLASHLLLSLASLSPAAAAGAIKGFNSGSTFTNNAPKTQADFEAEFTAARNLVNAPGFTSARLFTSIQAGTDIAPIAAIPAALATQTTLLLGIWASAGPLIVNNELAALTAAAAQHGAALAALVVGISVGSEDLYRISPTGVLNKSNPGAEPATIAGYIAQVRAALAGTPLAGKPVGHVDTWTAWVNGSNAAVVEAADFLGVDAYPYFQNTQANGIENAAGLFFAAFDATVSAARGKPVWITETGWPVAGPTEGQAVPGVQNAKAYWDAVGCKVFGNVNAWWFILDDGPVASSPSFGITGLAPSSTALFDLTCPAGVRERRAEVWVA